MVSIQEIRLGSCRRMGTPGDRATMPWRPLSCRVLTPSPCHFQHPRLGVKPWGPQCPLLPQVLEIQPPHNLATCTSFLSFLLPASFLSLYHLFLKGSPEYQSPERGFMINSFWKIPCHRTPLQVSHDISMVSCLEKSSKVF